VPVRLPIFKSSPSLIIVESDGIMHAIFGFILYEAAAWFGVEQSAELRLI